MLKLFDYSGYLRDQRFVQTGGNWWNPTGYYEDVPIDGSWAPSGDLGNLRDGTGINNNRTLLCSGSGISGTSEAYNNFTGTRPEGTRYYSGYANQDIVKYNLGSDDFPVLKTIKDGTKDVAEG